jgi:hypothetical protein
VKAGQESTESLEHRDRDLVTAPKRDPSRAKQSRNLVRSLWKRRAQAARHVENPPEADQVGPRRTEAMHQHDQRSIAAAFTVLPTRQSNLDAAESFFSHVGGV